MARNLPHILADRVANIGRSSETRRGTWPFYSNSSPPERPLEKCSPSSRPFSDAKPFRQRRQKVLSRKVSRIARSDAQPADDENVWPGMDLSARFQLRAKLRGRRTENVVPASWVEVTAIVPWCAEAISLTINRPSPSPVLF